METAKIQNTADVIRQKFRERKAIQSGRRYNPAARYDSDELWLKAAEVCLKVNADPENFVAAAFRYNRVFGGPFPQQLSGKAAESWYGQYAETYKKADNPTLDPYVAEISDTIQHAVTVAMRDCGGNFREAMLDECLWHIPDYVRVILFPKDEEALSKFGRSAYGQLTANPRLIKLLSDKHYDLNWMERFA